MINFLNKGFEEAVGCIDLGIHKEEFVSTCTEWSCEDYQSQWAGARIDIEKNKDTYFVSDWAPNSGLVIATVWIAYFIDDEIVAFQNKLVFGEECRDILEYDIPARTTVNEDGDRISEWLVSKRQLDTLLGT